MSERAPGQKPKSTNMYVVRGKKAFGTEGRAVADGKEKLRRKTENDRIDELFGFTRFTEGSPRIGWLLNYIPTTMLDENSKEKAGLELYFIDQAGGNFKCSLLHDPYFYIDISPTQHHRLNEISNFLVRKYEGCRVNVVGKEDLDLPNHLAGVMHKFLCISFDTVSALVEAKNEIKTHLDHQQSKTSTIDDDPLGNVSSAMPLDP
eukprot:gene46030-56345_t